MRENSREQQNQEGVEKVVLLFYTIHMICMTAIAIKFDWKAWVPAVMMASIVLSGTIIAANYKTFLFRAVLNTVLVFNCLVIYSFNEPELRNIIPVLLSMTVLIGLYGIPQLTGISTLASIIIYFNAFVIQKNIGEFGTSRYMYDIILCINVFFVQAVIRFWLEKRKQSHEQIMSIISNLEKAEKSKDDFLANISHEIRTPVNTICGMSDLALQDTDIEHIREKLWDIRSSGRNLTSIVSDVLDFSELQAENVELQEETYNITSTINDIITMAYAKKEDKSIEIIVNCDATLPNSLYGDEKKLRRVIHNLVDNAIKFTDEGGIIIDISGRKEEYGINLVISVKDTGIGISEENLEELFTSFNQIDAKRNRKEGGMGLGLAISQCIVRKMGGVITVKTELGKGSIFKFVVPQKVIDEAPIVSLDNPELINVATFLNMEQISSINIRDEYNELIDEVKEQLKIKCHACMNLAELKRRQEIEHFTHIFIGVPEYQLDPGYFDSLAKKTNVAVVLEPKQDKELGSDALLRLYKPFYLLSIVSVLNGNIKESDTRINLRTNMFTAPTAHILIVDDNQMNIRVVEGLLAPYHMKITSANSGKEALGLVDSMDYDLIFMDHMMPEMDGVEAMHRIRDKGRAYFRNLPIIALTANAIAGTREMFMREGFNDYVEKPVEASVLHRALMRNLPEEKVIYEVEAESVAGGIIESGKESDVIQDKELDFGDLDIEKGILYCGGKEKYIEILKMYAREADNQRRNLTKLYDSNDWKDYTISVHALKSSMLSIGALTLSEMAKKLEKAGKENDVAYIKDNHFAMLKEFNRIMAILNNSFSSVSDEKNKKEEAQLPVMSAARFKEMASVFENAAYILDKKQMVAVLDELADYQYRGAPIADDISTIRRKVEMSDYISAADALQKMAEKGEE